MKFLADVNVSRRVVEGLCALGLDVVRVSDVMDCRATDAEILEKARQDNATVISHDQDFTAILATTHASQPSLVNLRVTYVDVDRQVRAIAAVVHVAGQDLSTGAIVTVDDCGARIHLLPVR